MLIASIFERRASGVYHNTAVVIDADGTYLEAAAQVRNAKGEAVAVLYVLQGMRRQPGPITDVFAGVMPFMGVYMLAILILMAAPGIALWLPSVLM